LEKNKNVMRLNGALKMNTYVLLLLLTAMQSCKTFYKVAKPPANSTNSEIVIQSKDQRYFILRSGDSAYHMKDITFIDKKSLSCVLEPLPPEHRLHLITDARENNMTYKKNSSQAEVLNETHIYIDNDSSVFAGNKYILTLDKIKRVEVLEKDKANTAVSHVFGYIGLGILAATIFTVVALVSSGGPI
jgi:hypothetical protein